jgi:hypothetical protein
MRIKGSLYELNVLFFSTIILRGIVSQFLAFLLSKATKDCFEQREQSRTCSDYAESRKTTNWIKTKNAFCGCACPCDPHRHVERSRDIS